MARRKKGLNFTQKRKKISSSIVREIWTYIFLVLASILVAFVMVSSIGMKVSNLGSSMEPALYNAQEVFVNRFVYKLLSPQVGDVVVFYPNGNQNSHYYIKRVAARPGDTISINNGSLYVNGSPYRAVSLDKIADVGILENDLTLEENEYFVVGDNINNSEDSRSSNIGPIKKTNIVGKVWFHKSSTKSGMGFVK